MEDHTEAPLILFDGVCNLCNASVQWVLLRDRAGIFRFAALQSETGQARLRALGFSTEQFDTIVLIHGGRCYTHSDAALEVCRLLGRPYSWLHIFRWIPRFIRDGAYRVVARYRYRWFGQSESCLLPRPEWRNRFV
jgi:predicted DCC family thiol-disulfide oxidoreductase YuxK